MSRGTGHKTGFSPRPIPAAFAHADIGAARAAGAGTGGGCLSFAFGRERPRAVRFAIRLVHGNFWLESGLTSKPIQRRVALGVKAFSICNSPVITSSHSALHGKGFALLCPQ